MGYSPTGFKARQRLACLPLAFLLQQALEGCAIVFVTREGAKHQEQLTSALLRASVFLKEGLLQPLKLKQVGLRMSCTKCSIWPGRQDKYRHQLGIPWALAAQLQLPCCVCVCNQLFQMPFPTFSFFSTFTFFRVPSRMELIFWLQQTILQLVTYLTVSWL